VGRNNHIHNTVGTPQMIQDEYVTIHKDSSPLFFYNIVFFRYFSAADGTDKLIFSNVLIQKVARRCLPNITVPDIITFLVSVLQMRHVLQDKLQDHWSRLEQFYITFYNNTTTQIFAYSAIFCILRTNAKDLPQKWIRLTM